MNESINKLIKPEEKSKNSNLLFLALAKGMCHEEHVGKPSKEKQYKKRHVGRPHRRNKHMRRKREIKARRK